MKKLFALLLAIPLTAMAAEHGGKAMKNKGADQRSSEHAGKAAGHRQAKEHAGKPAAGKQTPDEKKKEHAGSPMH